MHNSGLLYEGLWPTCLVSLPLPLRSPEEKETPGAHPLGLEQSRTEPGSNDEICHKAIAPSSGTNRQQGIVGTPGDRNQGQKMTLSTLFYKQNSFSLGLMIA